MRKNFLGIACVLVSTGLMAGSAIAQEQKFVSIGTGGVTGVYYPTGGAICRLVNRGRKEHGIRCGVESTGGSVFNINAVRGGELEFGVAQSDWQYHAYHGTSRFEEQGPFEGLRAIFAVHPEPFTVVARADAGISTFEDLKGKRVNVGNPGSGQRGTMEVLMDAMGWTMGDFALSSELQAAEQSQALCDNNIDAMVYTVGHPSGSIQEATTSCDSVLVTVQNDATAKLIADNPYYRAATIPGGMYRGNDEDVATFGVGATFVSSTDVPEDIVANLAYAYTSFFTSEPAEELAEFLAARAPGDLNRVYFVSGGSEAMEAALKLARQYHVEAGKPEKSQIIGRWQSYHGNTLGALATGGNRWRRAQFAPLLSDSMHHIDPCYAYRGQLEDETEFDYGQRVANQLEEKILQLGADTVAAFVAEPVVGATMGAVPSVDGYFKRIRSICNKYDVLLILDEVMCGMGRTGHLFACNHDSIVPDMITIAKGLGAGYQPIGALMVSDRIFDTLAAGTGFFQHGHTYLGHPTACAGAMAVMHEIEEQNLLQAVRQRGEALRASLTDRFGNHPNVGDIRGRGLFLGLELVEDRVTKAAFDPSKRLNARLKSTAMKAGLMCYPMGGTIDGQAGDHILLAPPFIIDDSHVAEITDKLSIALDETLAAIR